MLPSLTEIIAIAHDQIPTSLGDLQVWILEELKVVQDKIRADDADSWRSFYDNNGVPKGEERCRDLLLGLLRQGSPGITFDPESHVAGDKEVDISSSAGALRLPVEMKGQWHRDVWTAADEQLDRLYASDWRAAGWSIYLVLWFGEQKDASKNIASPGRGIARPASPEKMTAMLMSRSQSVQEGRIKVVVLDLTRPSHH